jgi:AcrR family transcriptional regulator
MTPVESLSERRRRITRSELARVAVALWSERGFDGVTVDDISAAAGMSGRTFFRYFATKEEVVLHYVQLLNERLLRALDAQPDTEDAVSALHNAYVATSRVDPRDRERTLEIGRVLESAPSLWAAVNGAPTGEADELVGRVARRMGSDPSERTPRVIVAAMSAVAASEWRAWVADGDLEADPSARIATALTLLEDGLKPLEQPGSERRKRRA